MITVRQCLSCPWRVDCEPERDIPNYDCALASRLGQTTIRSGLKSISSTLHIMACHYSKPGEEFACAGWLHNQIGTGNNIGVRLRVATGQLPVPEVDGEQHEHYEDTLCHTEEGANGSERPGTRHQKMAKPKRCP